jgi:hypothetical protein
LGRSQEEPQQPAALPLRLPDCWQGKEWRRPFPSALNLERDFEESLSPSGQISLANDARRDDSKTIQMLDVVLVVRAADLHSVQDIVEINHQLRRDSFAEEEPLWDYGVMLG